MGNVLASSKSITSGTSELQKVAGGLTPDSLSSPQNDFSTLASADPKEPLENPGSIEELHKRCKGQFNYLYLEYHCIFTSLCTKKSIFIIFIFPTRCHASKFGRS